MLQARGREMARVLLMGIWKGTLPVTMRHKQPMPELVRDLSALQQSEVGAVPLPLLFVTKFMQGVKLEIIEGEHGELICPWTGIITTIIAIARAGSKHTEDLNTSMSALLGFRLGLVVEAKLFQDGNVYMFKSGLVLKMVRNEGIYTSGGRNSRLQVGVEAELLKLTVPRKRGLGGFRACRTCHVQSSKVPHLTWVSAAPLTLSADVRLHLA